MEKINDKPFIAIVSSDELSESLSPRDYHQVKDWNTKLMKKVKDWRDKNLMKKSPVCPICKHKMWLDIVLETDPHEYRWGCMCSQEDLMGESHNFEFIDKDHNEKT